MNKTNSNPCDTCSTGYGCCSLKGTCGLMLTKEEFEKHFSGHTEGLVIMYSKKYVIISSKDGFVCPHLDSKGCKIYHNRPIDCRLFPYMMSNLFEKRKKISIVFHDRSDCPQRTHLLQPEDEARHLVMEFARSVFGTTKPISVHYEKRKTLFFSIRKVIDRTLAQLWPTSK